MNTLETKTVPTDSMPAKKSLLNPNSRPSITWKSKSRGCVCWKLSVPASLPHKFAS